MNILVTGAFGFIGKNFVETLKTIRDGKNNTRPNLNIEQIFEVGRGTPREELEEAVGKADVVVHLAGINRPQTDQGFWDGNVDFSKTICDLLLQMGSKVPIIVSSSKQATLEGRYTGSLYGLSKKAGEQIFLEFQEKNGNPVYLYRLPNVFGKWCQPNYNSVIATFCHNLSHDLPIQVSDEHTVIELVYIDDVIHEFLNAIEGTACPSGEVPFYQVPVTASRTLGDIVTWLKYFKEQPITVVMPAIPEGSFEKKLYSTYISYLPSEKVSQPLTMHVDARGSFTEFMRTADHGQVSINISKPGIIKGEHWHHSKWEIFLVVSGTGLIQQRKIGLDEQGNPYPVIQSYVSGEKLEAVYILPGYTHNIINLSETEDLVTVMWVNETFKPDYPETYFEPVTVKNGLER